MKKFSFVCLIMLSSIALAQWDFYTSTALNLDILDSQPIVNAAAYSGIDLALSEYDKLGVRLGMAATPYFFVAESYGLKMGADIIYRRHLNAQHSVYAGASVMLRIATIRDKGFRLPTGYGWLVGYEYLLNPDEGMRVFAEASVDFSYIGDYTAVNPNISIGLTWPFWLP